jgi:formylglycine-generating enzyme required for sulfatase activity
MNDDPVKAALSAFQKAWYEGDPPALEQYLKNYPEYSNELRKQIENFLLVVEGLPAAGGDVDRSSSLAGGEVGEFEEKILGDFRIFGEIGRGGMGVVYEAEQISLKRNVALKILPPHLLLSDEMVQKFHREAEAGGRQKHPGIVAVHAVGEEKGIHYIVQELVEGGVTLADKLEELETMEDEPPLGYFRDTARVVSRVAEALGHAHESGVIHRDIKPSNILLTSEGDPKVSDFGLAKIEDALALSRTGDLAGTPYYMSPEQAASKRIKIDHRTDIFSLGVTLYEMLTLKRPFEGKTSHEVLKKIVFADPPDPYKRNPRVPRDLSTICLKAIEKSPDKRYQTMEELREDLVRFLSGEVILAKPAGPGTRVWKWVKRNPVVSSTVGVALAALVVFAVVVPWVIATKERELRAAEETARIEIEKQRNAAVVAREEAITQRRNAEEQRKAAEAEKERALIAEKTAKERYEQIIRLADVKRLNNLETESESLWPSYPEKVEAFKDWIGRAEELIARLDIHLQTLEKIREQALLYGDEDLIKDRESHPRWTELLELQRQREQLDAIAEGMDKHGSSEEGVLPEVSEEGEAQRAKLDEEIDRLIEETSKRRTWKFKDTETQWRHDTLHGLVSGVMRLMDKDNGLLKDVRERLEFAETIEKRSIDDHRNAWSRAIASIGDKNTCPQYEGLVIEPVIGIIPVGQDPVSGLWEFAHLQTGAIPERDSKGKLILTEETGLVFVLIPGGTFKMGTLIPSDEHPVGSPNVDPDTKPDETPAHQVTLKPFMLSKYEMTQGQWFRFTKNNPSTYGPSYSSVINVLHPVESVTWIDCTEVLFNLKLRLPTESEWEYACRAGTTTVFNTGDDKKSLKGSANIADLYCKKNGGPPYWPYEEWLDDGHMIHAPVGSYLPNAFGLHDVHGNISEWCADTYGRYDNWPADGSANMSGSSHRVARGGSGGDGSGNCRSAYRRRCHPRLNDYFLGLRPVIFH